MDHHPPGPREFSLHNLQTSLWGPPPIQLLPGSLYPEVKLAYRAPDHAPSSDGEVRNIIIYIPLLHVVSRHGSLCTGQIYLLLYDVKIYSISC
jgi:hypothetical protein